MLIMFILGQEEVELPVSKSFDEKVSNLVSSRHMKSLDHPILNLSSNIVTINLYVLCTLVEY